MRKRPDNRTIILRMIKQNSRVTLGALCAATGLQERSNVRYHIRRLMADGLVVYRGDMGERRCRKLRTQGRFPHGSAGMRKMSEAELARRIKAVVAKARRNGTLGTQRQDAFAENWPVLRRTLKAWRIG